MKEPEFSEVNNSSYTHTPHIQMHGEKHRDRNERYFLKIQMKCLEAKKIQNLKKG